MRTLRLSVVCLFVIPALLVLSQRLPAGFVSSGQTSSALYAPAGVVASDNSYSTKVGVTWEAVRGATSYRILRNTTNDSSAAVSLGTTAAGVFFDTTAAAGQTFFYWVRAENGSNVGPLSQPEQGTRANGLTVFGPVAPLNPPQAPGGNQVTAAKAALGKTLFWDEQLSQHACRSRPSSPMRARSAKASSSGKRTGAGGSI